MTDAVAQAPPAASDAIERAVADDEQRIAVELGDTVIRDLFGVGLTLQGVLPHVTGPGEQRLSAAVDDIDRIIRTIRNVVFALGPRPPPPALSGSNGAGSRAVDAHPPGFR